MQYCTRSTPYDTLSTFDASSELLYQYCKENSTTTGCYKSTTRAVQFAKRYCYLYDIPLYRLGFHCSTHPALRSFSARDFHTESLFIIMTTTFRFVIVVLSILLTHISSFTMAAQVIVEKKSPTPEGAPRVTTRHKYRSHVTLYIEHADGSKTPSGWSTRVSDGAPEDAPFEFQPGLNLIEGWTQGVLEMYEGERAWLHVPAELGYGPRAMGSPNGGGFYIPASSNLLFDIEILGKANASPDL